MIEILPVKDKEVLENLVKQNNVSAQFAYCYYEGKEITGYLLYNICDNIGQVKHIDYNNLAQLDGLVRATMASLSEIKIDSINFENIEYTDDLVKLSFITNSSKLLNSINDFLSGCKNCKK